MSFRRDEFTTVDSFGVDPLGDAGFAAVSMVSVYSNYRVSSHEEGRPELISFNHYGTVDLWWAILAYNGLTDVRLIRTGTTLKIPDKVQIAENLSQQRRNQGRNLREGNSVLI